MTRRLPALLALPLLLSGCSGPDIERLAISLAAGACQASGGCTTYCADGRTAESKPGLSCQ